MSGFKGTTSQDIKCLVLNYQQRLVVPDVCKKLGPFGCGYTSSTHETLTFRTACHEKTKYVITIFCVFM